MDEITIQKNKNKNSNESINPSNKNQSNNENKNLTIDTNTDITTFPLSEVSSDENVTISPIKLMMTSASSKSTLIEPLCKLEKFLPPLNILNLHKKTLVLDLDETLIHSYFDHPPPRPPDISFDIFIEKKKIHVNSILRPGVREFLDNLEKYFEIVVFTASLSQYANPVLDFIDKKGICKFRLYREHCCCFTNGFANSFIKDLKKLDRDMKNLIIIDNNPRSFMLNKENGVPIKTWVEDKNDRELYKLIPYLLFLANEKIGDVRPFLKEINSGNSLNYEKFDKIISEYNIKKEKELEFELNNIKLQDLNENIYESINDTNINGNKNNGKKIKKNKEDKKIKKEKDAILNSKNNINEKPIINKENKTNKNSTKNNNEIKIDNKENKENKDMNNNNGNKIKNIIDNDNISTKEETKNKSLESKNNNDNNKINTNNIKENKNINNNSNKDNHIENNDKEIVNKPSNSKNLFDKNNLTKKDDKKQENKIQNNIQAKEAKKEHKKTNNNINILKRNENIIKEIINKSKRNNSVINYNESILRKFTESKLANNKMNNIEKNNDNEKYSLKKEDMLIDEYNTFDKSAKPINKEIKTDNNKTTRENLSISLNKVDKNVNIFFLKKISNINIFRNNQIKNEQRYNPTNELLNQFLKSLNNNSNLNTSIKINKSIQFSEQDKTIINDDNDEEEKKGEQPIFDDIIDIEENTEKTKSLNKEEKNDDIKDKEQENENNESSIPANEKKSIKKKRKINKNLFNKGKINKYQLNINNIKDNNNNNNKLLINGLFLNNNNNNNNNKEKLDIKIEEKFDYLSKRNFCKDIFTMRKKDSLYSNNISTSNYKLFKEKEKEKSNIYLKNKSNLSNEAIDFSLSNPRSMSKHNSNLFEMSKTLVSGSKTNKNKLYKLKKNQDSIDFSNKNEKIYLYKNSAMTKRATSCVNKKYEGIINHTNNISHTSNINKIERNKKVIRFIKQDKKIYLKTNNDKKTNSKKAKINLNNINNIEINLNDDKKNEDEDSKENNNIKEINNILIEPKKNNKSPKRNIFTDISLKNLKEANNTNKKIFNNIFEIKGDNDKEKKIKFKNKAILL